jgi:hypothetical protein
MPTPQPFEPQPMPCSSRRAGKTSRETYFAGFIAPGFAFFEPFADFLAMPILLQMFAPTGLQFLYANRLVMSTENWASAQHLPIEAHLRRLRSTCCHNWPPHKRNGSTFATPAPQACPPDTPGDRWLEFRIEYSFRFCIETFSKNTGAIRNQVYNRRRSGRTEQESCAYLAAAGLPESTPARLGFKSFGNTLRGEK